MDVFERLQALKKDLVEQGCRVEMHVSVGIYRIDVYNPKFPHIAGKAARLSEAQKAIIRLLKHEGEYRLSLKQARANVTIKALLKRGLIDQQFNGPSPGNDYGGWMTYRLTDAGKAVIL